MPVIVGLQIVRHEDPLLNGVVADFGRKGTRTLLYGDLPASVRAQSIAQQEAWINTWLASNMDGQFAKVHIYSLDPVNWVYVVSQYPIDPSWPLPPLG